MPVPAGALCPQIPSGAVAFREESSLSHPRRLLRSVRASHAPRRPLFRSSARLGPGRQAGIGQLFPIRNPLGQSCDANET